MRPASVDGRPQLAAPVILPSTISYEWPERPTGQSLVELLSEPDGHVPASLLLVSLPRLLPVLEQWHQQGTAVLAPWSLRLVDGAVAAWCAPGMGGTVAWPEQLRLVSSHGPRADLHAMGMLVHRMASGHWASSAHRAVVEAGVLGGEWPLGTDLAVIACLHPEPGRGARTAGDLLARLAPFLDAADRPRIAEGTRVQVADESVTGWTKTRGRPTGDNEDAAVWDWTPDGVVAAVLDGVSGAGDGGGRWASRTLRKRLRAQWKRKVWDPGAALDAAVDAMGVPPQPLSPEACTVGIVVRLGSRRLQWVSVGDCRLYLARPRVDGTSVCRLTPEDSLVASSLRAGLELRAEDAGAVTNALPRPGRTASTGSVEIRLGDVVLLVSDGACVMPEDDVTLDGWRFADVLADLLASVDQSHAPLLVSLLCRRSEELGGEDNATALAIVCGPVPTSVLDHPPRRRSRLSEQAAPLIAEG